MFKRGNVVKLKYGFRGEPLEENSNNIRVIEYSYAEKYGGKITDDYCLIDPETGCSSAWWDEDKLEFVEEGGIEKIEECYKNKEKYIAKCESIDYIKECILNKIPLNSISILELFKKIEYDSGFNRNGEYFTLFSDWNHFKPIFICIFNNNYDEMISYINDTYDRYEAFPSLRPFVSSAKEILINKAARFFNEVNNKEGE